MQSYNNNSDDKLIIITRSMEIDIFIIINNISISQNRHQCVSNDIFFFGGGESYLTKV